MRKQQLGSFKNQTMRLTAVQFRTVKRGGLPRPLDKIGGKRYLAALRQQTRQPSGFREHVMDIVEQVAKSANIIMRRDVPADESQSILVDAYLVAPRPIIIIAATTTLRLMEAEMIFLDCARRKEPTYVLALVEDARAIGIKQYTRANYYTDKTVEFATDKAIADLIGSQISSSVH